MSALEIPNQLARELADIDAPCAQFTADDPEHGWNPSEYNIVEIVENRPTGELKRWTSIYELIIRTKDGSLWQAFYEEGLTERQDYYPFEFDGPVIGFTRVQPFIKSVLEYRPVD